MASTLIVVGGIIGGAYVLSPFVLWRSFFLILKRILVTRDLGTRSKLKLLLHLTKELLYLPLLTLLWFIDELWFHAFRTTEVKSPIFIMSQPRSGTTFLLRTLSLDSQTFFSLKHLEWRLPFIVLWKALDRLGLRERVEKINYWRNTEPGRLASKLHFHELGSFEEHGIFFEERMYHHYFTFRRFPLPEILARVTDIENLSNGEKRKLVRTFKKVVQKASYYRGAGRIWLTKENESVDLYRILHEAFPNARFLVIVREPSAFVSSYITMSNTCTAAKHGIDPNTIPKWYDANLQFRRHQCLKQKAFSLELEKCGAVTYITFKQFTTAVAQTVRYIYSEMNIPMSDEYSACLEEIQRKQSLRVPGYTNKPCDISGFEDFTEFVKRAEDRPTSSASGKEPVVVRQ